MHFGFILFGFIDYVIIRFGFMRYVVHRLTRLPQGRVASPSDFQAVIENVFLEKLQPYVTCYIDYVLTIADMAQNTCR